MTSERLRHLLLIVAIAVAVAACNTENRIEDGLVLHLAESHTQARPDTTPVTPGILPDSDTVEGGYDQESLEKHPVRDVNDTVLLIYRAYLTLDDLELVPCTSLSAALGDLPGRLLDIVMPRARAHPGHGTEPVGGRSLDQPNIIDIVTQEGFVLPLGDRAVAPGRYCGLRVALVRLASEGYGTPEPVPASLDDPTTEPGIPDLSGRMFALRADYCAETDAGECTRRIKVDIDDDGLAEPAPVTLEFDQPLEVSTTLREIFVVLGIAYGEWVQDVDVTLLATDPVERGKLLANIVGSLHVGSIGLGALPVNIVE